MREIKLRAWDIEKKYMFKIFDNTSNENWFLPHCNEKFKVMQYTDLKDKNGVEILEGDIVRDNRICDIKWMLEHCAFMARMVKPKHGYLYLESDGYFKNIEVIGNIHQNPELLVDGRE